LGDDVVRTCDVCGQKNRVGGGHLARTVRCGKCRHVLGPVAEPIDADEQLFDEVLREATVPVLVDFWAAWCGPCHMAAPEVQRVASEMAGRAIVLKVDTDRHAEVAARYGVRGIPHFVVLKDGRTVFQRSGVARAADLRQWIEGAQTAEQG
jgi:thioredoxin 2